MIIETPHFKIYFGNTQDAISKSVDCIPFTFALRKHKKFAPIAQQLAVEQLAFLNQTHSNQGMIIDQHIPAFDSDGDFLITSKPAIGIGVMTADCLPIIIYDQKKHVAAVVHAGWRGTVTRIAQKAVDMMQKELHSSIHDMQIFFGPSANNCCYHVKNDFVQNNEGLPKNIFIQRDGNLYFDLPLFNSLQLQELGISASAISRDYNFCTICDHRFFSYRRQGEAAGRQMTVVSLK